MDTMTDGTPLWIMATQRLSRACARGVGSIGRLKAALADSAP